MTSINLSTYGVARVSIALLVMGGDTDQAGGYNTHTEPTHHHQPLSFLYSLNFSSENNPSTFSAQVVTVWEVEIPKTWVQVLLAAAVFQ